MIKINLLPPHIIERRRVKAVAILLGVVLVIVVFLLAAVTWGPLPGISYAERMKAAEARRNAAQAAEKEVTDLQAETSAVEASYAAKGAIVTWVDNADRRPAEWVTYFNMVNQYIPADVVINGLPLPNGTNLNLTGSTSDLMAAARWYLNMLRCEMVDTSVGLNAVQFNPGNMSAGNPKMAMPVSMSLVLKAEWTDMMLPVPTPTSMGAAVRGRGGGGARMGAGGRGMGGGRGMAGRGERGGGRGRAGRGRAGGGRNL